MSVPSPTILLAPDPVAAEEAGGRLDKWLAGRCPELSRTRIKALIESGRVAAGGATVADASARVKPGQAYTVAIPPDLPAEPAAQAMDLVVVYEDADLIVVDKPAGLVVHPAPGSPDRTLVNALLAHCGETLSGIGGVRRPGIVHRLDKDTSGLLVFTRTWLAKESLTQQFREHTVLRRYLAIAAGDVKTQTIQSTIVADRGDGLRGSWLRARRGPGQGHEGGQRAVTHVTALEQLDGATLIECKLETGRTHQIRIHLSEAGHPLVGEQVYIREYRDRSGVDEIRAPRMMLHAAELGFVHPSTEEDVKWEKGPPRDFEETLLRLRRSAGAPAASKR